MSEKLQNNPFAALFSCVKDAEVYSQQHLTIEETTHPPTIHQEQQELKGTDNNNTSITTFLEHLLLITTRADCPHTAPRVLLSTTDPLTADTFPSLLFDRLLLESSNIKVVGPQREEHSNAAPNEMMVYLCDVYRRCWAARDRTLGHIAAKVMEVVVTNLATALEQPELYPAQKVNQQLLRVLLDGLGRDGAVEDLTRSLVTLISKEGASVPPRVFEVLLADITTQLGSCSLMAVDFRLLEIMEFYASLPLLAPLLARVPEGRQGELGRSYHQTPLGSILSISCLPHHGGAPSAFFDKPSSKPGHVHKDTEKNIWLAQRNLSIVTYKIFYKLLKVSTQAKDGLLSWIDSCLHANRGRAGLWHLQGAESGIHSIHASDGFMINLGAVMLQLAQPFTQDIKTAKILKVDPTYCTAKPVTKGSGIPGAYTRAFENLTTLVSHSEDSVRSHSQEYSFISSCFFLTHRSIHLGMQVAQQKLTKISQELGRLHQNEHVTDVMRQYVETRTADLLSLKAVLFEPHLTESLLQFLGATTEWLIQISLSPTNQLTPPTTLREVKLPNTDDDEEPPHPFLQCIPEFLVENLTEAVSSVQHYTSGLMDAAGDKAILSQLMSFIVVFMGSSKRMTNPHLRAQLATCLEILLPESKTSSGGLWVGFQEQLFHSHPLSRHLVSTLLHVFVSIEMTGQNVAFEEKFGYRRPMYEIMKYLWELPSHRRRFSELATEALSSMESAKPPLFLRFVNLLINDSIYLLDEGLSYMLQLRESQNERDGGEWDKLSPGQRETRERTFQSMMMMARFHNTLGSHTIQILIRLTKEIPHMFTHNTLVDRMAAMLNYFLSRLVGPKQRDLKVRYMEKYEFRPAEIVTDICTIYTHLYGNSSFCLAVCSDGRSYTPQLFSQASDVLCRVGRRFLAEEIEKVGEAVVEAGKTQAEDEDIASEAPEEFLDPIMSHLMTDPVILPSSKLTIDRQTIARHLLSDQIDPFNRQPLTMEEVVPNTELKTRITRWLEEKRNQRAASAASASSSQSGTSKPQ